MAPRTTAATSAGPEARPDDAGHETSGALVGRYIPRPMRALFARHGGKTAALFALMIAAGGCSDSGGSSLSEQAQKGRAIYMNVCIACHNGNPAVDGTIGPAIAGASEALLHAKVLEGTYPAGYTPKRPGSHTMPKFPHLKDQIPALAAYLAEVPQQ